MAKLKGLGGMGIDALLKGSTAGSGDYLCTLAVADIVPGRYQPRVGMDETALNELADSIRAQGIIQPVIVREKGVAQYELIAGERRWRAAQIAGLKEIPAVVKMMDDTTALAIGLIENIQRENLNPIDEAVGMQRLCDEFSLTHQMVAQALGRSRSSITNSLRLLKLPENVQDLLRERRLEMGHARALLGLPENQQRLLAEKAAQGGWSVREVERRVKKINQPPAPTEVKSPEVQALEAGLTQSLAVPVRIDSTNGRSGRLVLHFDTPETLEYLMSRLGVEVKL